MIVMCLLITSEAGSYVFCLIDYNFTQYYKNIDIDNNTTGKYYEK